MPRVSKSSKSDPDEAAGTCARDVALLRGVNVGGSGVLAMEKLRTLLAGLGYTDVSTILQSGNVVLSTKEQSPASIEEEIEKEISKRLGHALDVLVRTEKEWAKIVQQNPFAREAKDDSSHLLVMFLKAAPKKEQLVSLQADVRGPEIIRGIGRELYITYPDGIGRSRLTGALIEKKLSCRGTARNWNTIHRIASCLAK